MDGRDPQPPLDRLADRDDDLDWDRHRDGTMVDHATADDATTTVPYEPKG